MAGSAIDFGVVRTAENVVDAYIIEIREDDQRFRGWNALAGFVFRDQGLLDTCLHLKRKLGQPAFFSQLAEDILHAHHQ